MITNVLRPDGPRLLLAIVRTRGLAEVAKKCGGVSENAIRHWYERRRKPNGDARLALNVAYGIPMDALWGEAAEPSAEAVVEPPPEPEPAPVLPSASSNATARERLRTQLDRLEQRIQRADADKIDPLKIAGLERAYTFCSTQYAKLSGETELTESTILRSDVFRRVVDEIFEALEPFADALVAVDRTLKRRAK